MNNSFGIIVFTETQPRRFLIVQRRDSLAFLKLIRKFHTLTRDQILEYINKITSEEAQRLLSNNFSQIWADLYLNHNSRIYNTEERKVRANYEKLVKTFSKELLKAAQNSDNILEWGFPKGKRNPNESSLTCAFREFREETRINSDKLWMVNTNPFYYDLDYGNGHITRVECWLSKIKTPVHVRTNSTQLRSYISDEVGQMEWVTYEILKSRLPQTIQKTIDEVDLFVNLHF